MRINLRMNVQSIFALAAVAGAGAAYLAVSQLSAPGAGEGSDVSRPAVVELVAADRDMSVGTIVRSEDVRILKWPASEVPDGYSRSPSDVVGRGLIMPVVRNEPLLAAKLASREAGGGLSIAIPPGKRAMSVRVDEVAGVAGFVLPGSRVDVVVTLDEMTGQREPRSRIVLQSLRVLAAGQTVERQVRGEPRSVPVVTLLVDASQAERLALAATEGNIRLALRNTLDLEEEETYGVRASQLMRSRPAVRRPRRTRGSTTRTTTVSVEVYRGATRNTTSVKAVAGRRGS